MITIQQKSPTEFDTLRIDLPSAGAAPVIVIPDKGDNIVVQLGINNVTIRYCCEKRTWEIQHNKNVLATVVPTNSSIIAPPA